MARIAHILDILASHEPVLAAVAGNVPGMAANATPGSSGASLPAGKVLVPVIVPAFFSAPAGADTRNCDLLLRRKSALGHLLVAL